MIKLFLMLILYIWKTQKMIWYDDFCVQIFCCTEIHPICHPLTFFLDEHHWHKTCKRKFLLVVFLNPWITEKRKKKAWQSLLNIRKILEDVGYSCSRLKKKLKDCFDLIISYEFMIIGICPNSRLQHYSLCYCCIFAHLLLSYIPGRQTTIDLSDRASYCSERK
jgi:hypothetical protein